MTTSNIEIRLSERRSNVLTPSQLPCLNAVPSVNLTEGCAHGCVYCYARSYSRYPGERTVVVYRNTARKIHDELVRKRRKPSHVYFSPSTDVFQPVDCVLDMAYEIFSDLFAAGVGIAIVTKGVIPERHMRLFEEHPDLLRVQVGLITKDSGVASLVEPRAASPEVRLAQMQRLARAGIETRIRVTPILPDVTDDDIALHDLFSAAAAVGVHKATINVLHLRPAITASLKRALVPPRYAGLMETYRGSSRLTVCGGKSSQMVLPRDFRAALLLRARQIAGRYGITAHLCGCMNPDLTAERCALAGEWEDDRSTYRQLDLC